MKKIIPASLVALFTALVLTVGSANAQNASSWELLKSTAQVDVYKQVSQCTVADVTMEYWNLKFVNKTAGSVTVKYHAEYYYQGETNCRTCANDEYKFQVVVPANSSVEANCSGGDYTNQAVYIKDINRTNFVTLQDYQLGSFTVE